jgi:hypothetical protein
MFPPSLGESEKQAIFDSIWTKSQKDPGIKEDDTGGIGRSRPH